MKFEEFMRLAESCAFDDDQLDEGLLEFVGDVANVFNTRLINLMSTPMFNVNPTSVILSSAFIGVISAIWVYVKQKPDTLKLQLKKNPKVSDNLKKSLGLALTKIKNNPKAKSLSDKLKFILDILA